MVAAKFRNFPHCACVYVIVTHCGNHGNSLSRFFGKKFVKVTVLLKKLLNSCFDGIFAKYHGGNLLSRFGKNFVKVTVFLNKLLKS